MYQARILDKNKQLKAVLPGVRWYYPRRMSEATSVEVYIPNTVIDQHISANHSLHEYFNSASKLKYAEIAAFVQIVKGNQIKVTGKINGRTLGQITTIHATTEEILMESNITPAQYGAVWDGWDIADLARDLFDGWQGLRVKDQSQWQSRIVAMQNVDVITIKEEKATDPGVAMLKKRSNGRYYESGYLTLLFNRSEINDFKRWDRVRWSADSDGAENPDRVVWTTIQTSTDGTSFSDPFDGGLPEEVGYAVSSDSDQVWVRINLHTSDTESPADDDPEEKPLGVTPTVFSCELLARTERYDLVPGSIPDVAGVAVTGLSADRATVLKVLVDACEQVGWEFLVHDGALNLAESLGVDRTKDFVFRQGTNTEITDLSDGDEGLVNVLTACGSGQGINRLEITLRDDESIAEYGEYPGTMEFNVSTLTELTQKAQEYLDEHKDPQMDFRIVVLFEPGKEPEYGLGDKVRVVDPESGVISTTRIVSETREYAENGLTVQLELGKPSAKLDEYIARDGKDGKDGVGRPGRPGKDGIDGIDGKDGEDYIPPIPATPVWQGYALSNRLTLTWAKAENANGYEIRSDLNWGSAEGMLYSGYAHEFSFTPTEREMILYIKAVNVAGEYSDNYDTLTVSLPAPTPPSQPMLTSYFSTIKIKVAPLNNPAVQGYYVYVTRGTEIEKINVLSGGEINYPAESGTTISVQVSAYDVIGEGAKSEPIQATTLALQNNDFPAGIVDRSKLSESLTTEIDTAGTNASSALTQIGALDGVVGGLNSDLAGTKQRIADAESEIVSAKDRLTGAEDEISGAKTRLISAEGKISSAETRLSGIDGEIAGAKLRLDSAEGEISGAKTRLDSAETDLASIEGTVSTHTTQITNLGTELGTKVSQTDFNALDGTVSDHSTMISQNATAIQTKADKATVDTLTGRVSTAEATLSTHADEIEARATKEEVDTLEGRVTEAEGQLTVQAGKIEAKAEKSEVQALEDDLSAVSTQVGTLTTSYENISARVTDVEGVTDDLTGEVSGVKSRTGALEVRAGNIEASVSSLEEDVDEHGNRLLTVENAVVEVLPGQIALKADASIVDEQGTRITTAEQNISALDGAITQTVARVDQSAILKPQGGKLWHFDTSLESTDGIKPLEGAVATLRPDEGKFGGAVAVEEGTTNLWTNPGWLDGSLTDWQTYSTSNATGSREVVENDRFGYALRLTKMDSGSGRWGIWQAKTWHSAGSYIADSIYVKVLSASSGAMLKLYSDYRNADGTARNGRGFSLNLSTMNISQGLGGATHLSITPVGDGWHRIEYVTLESDIVSGTSYYWIDGNAADILLAYSQKEAKPYPTSFIDGTRPDGILAYPITLKDDYTIACYRKPHTDKGYKHVVKRSDGKVFVDGVEDSEYDVGWLGYDGDTLMLSNQTGLIDELLVLDYEATEEEIATWHQAKGAFVDQAEINYQSAEISRIDQKADNISLAVANLDTSVGNQLSQINMDIDSISSVVYDETAGLSAAWSEINQTPTKISQAVANLKSDIDGDIADVYSDISQTASSINSTVSNLQTNLEGQIAAGDSALSGQITAIDQKADGISASVQSLDQGVTQQFADLNVSLDGIISTVGDAESGLVSQVTQLASEYTIKLNANGHVAGVGLATDPVSGASEFAILADKFSVATPTSTQNVFTVVEGKAYLNGDLHATGSILAEHLEADAIRTLLLEAQLARLDELDALVLRGDKLYIGDNINVANGRIAVERYKATTQKIMVTEDTYTESGKPYYNNSSDSSLRMTNRTYIGGRDIWMKMSLPDTLRSVESVTLNLRQSADILYAFQLHVGAPNQTWDYKQITWDNAPAEFSKIKVIDVTSSSEYWISIDITEYVQGWLSGELDNNGLVLRDIRDDDALDIHFRSSRYEDINLRPYIAVVGQFEGGELEEITAFGEVGGKLWGNSPLPAGSYGFWGEQSGIFMRGYPRLIAASTALDEQVIDLSQYPNLADPTVFVTPKELVTQAGGTGTISMYVDALKDPNDPNKYRLQAKSIIRSQIEQLGSRAFATSGWELILPTGLTNGKRGVETDAFTCRPMWEIYATGMVIGTPPIDYPAKLWMDITNQFNSSGQPINWQTVREETFSRFGEGVLEWDMTLPSKDIWAMRIRGQGGYQSYDSMFGVVDVYSRTGLQSSGYRMGDVYLNSKGEEILEDNPGRYPSGMSLWYMVFDIG